MDAPTARLLFDQRVDICYSIGLVNQLCGEIDVMNINLGPCESVAAPPPPDAACYRLAAGAASSFVLCVDRHSEDGISQAIRQQQFRYPPGYALLTELVPPGGRVLDLGGHIGTFSLWAAAQGYCVIAVEASPRNAELLRASAQQNDFTQLQIFQQAVADRAEIVTFLPAGPYGLIAQAETDAPTIQVPAEPVDDLLARMGWQQVDFIKLDVEGYEVNALRGMSQLLRQPHAPPIFFESNGFTLELFGQSPATLVAQLAEFGYQCYRLQEGDLVPVAVGDFQPECNVDCLALKRGTAYRPRRPIVVPLSYRARVGRLVAAMRVEQASERAYLGRTLASAAPTLVANRRIQAALTQLAHDPAAEVRQAVRWHTDRLPGWGPRLGALAREALDLGQAVARRLGRLGRG